MDVDPLTQVTADLYALPPQAFVAARNDAAKRARAAGDRRLAAEIGALRRPTVGAWVVNQLARQRPELVDELLALGESLRSAQRELRGDELRELSMRRREVVTALSREAIRLARREGQRDNVPSAEIEATLTAALADPAVAEQVRAGRLTRAVVYAGFGEPPRPKLRLIQGGGTAPAGSDETAPPATADEKAAEAERRAAEKAGRKADEKAAEAERRAAEKAGRKAAEKAARKAAEKAAEAERRAAEKAARKAAEKAAEAERRAAAVAAAAERRRARAAAHRELLAARTELAEAEAARTLAEKAVTAARRRVEKASAALGSLETDG